MSSKVAAYEKLGAFYLGRPYDPESDKTFNVPLLYDSKDLLTHAVCVGMTGSGKTGLCLSLLEEAALDGIPALVIDPKGDLGNLLLTFPDLAPADFLPWINPSDAQRQGQTPEEHAAAQAELWRRGLGEWDQDGERLRRLREAADFAIYTPGSEAGLPVSILASFNAPPPAIREDGDAMKERITTTVSSLLALLGIDADPIKSREHILLSSLLDVTWRSGRDLDLAGLIHAIQKPPLDRVGVFPLETFYPADERFELAMTVNNLLAAPGFQSWLEGTLLDLDQLLYTAEGKPRIAIFTISHLSDAERMFFVSLLLNQTLGWMRGRSGTTSLRALLYMDEVFGYLPPVANPPSKLPLLTLLKQARAFGLGLVLATQNPVDLDYKALSNIGTWFLGRLQTERDKERVLAGLEGVAGTGLSRSELERLLAGLDKRVFLLHNVHERGPVTFYVRWAMSYLRGPLTRAQIKLLMDDRRSEIDPRDAPDTPPPVPERAAVDAAAQRPVLPPDVEERFLPSSGSGALTYRPGVLGDAKVSFVDTRRGLEASEELVLVAEPSNDDVEIDWQDAEELQVDPEAFETEPKTEGASFGAVPASLLEADHLAKLEKKLADWLYRNRRVEMWKSPHFKLISQSGESLRDFKLRLQDAAREERDREVEKLRDRYARKIDKLQDRIRRAEQKVERERDQAQSQTMQSIISIGSSLLGAFMGRKRISTRANKLGTAVRSFNRRSKEAQDVDRAEESLLDLQQEEADLNAELEREIDALGERFRREAEEVEPFFLKPRRRDVEVRLVALVWIPSP